MEINAADLTAEKNGRTETGQSERGGEELMEWSEVEGDNHIKTERGEETEMERDK